MMFERTSLVMLLVSLGDQLNSLAESELPADDLEERWESLSSDRTRLWRQLGVDEPVLT